MGIKNPALRVIAEEWKNCTRCPLHTLREGGVIFGTGRSTSPTYLFVYDAPTQEDEENGAPFSGDGGHIFSSLLEEAKILQKDAYFTGALGCRPTTILAETTTTSAERSDRLPTKEEVSTCRTRVQQIIYATDPRLIFTLGAIAWKSVVAAKDRDGKSKLEKAVGNLVTSRIPGVYRELAYPVMPLYSMKQILASPSVAKHGYFGITLKYLEKGKEYLDYVKENEEADRTDFRA